MAIPTLQEFAKQRAGAGTAVLPNSLNPATRMNPTSQPGGVPSLQEFAKQRSLQSGTSANSSAGSDPSVAFMENKMQEHSGFLSRALGVMGRLVTGTGGIIKDAVTAPVHIALHPDEILSLGSGLIESVPGVKQLFDKATAGHDTTDLEKNRQVVQNLGKYAVDRYGSWDNIKKTAEKDPAGFLLDLSTVFDLGASGIGKVGEVAKLPELTKVAEAGHTAAEAVNPLTQITKGAGVVGSKILSKVEAPFASSYSPEIAAQFKRVGITDYPASAVTKSQFVKGAESLSAKGSFGQEIYDDITSTNEQLLAKQEELVAKLRPANLGTQEEIGTSVQQGLHEYESKFKATQGKVYDAFEKQAGSIPAVTSKTEKALQDIMGQQTKDVFSRPDGRYSKMYDTLKNSNAYYEKGRKLTFDELKATRTAIGADLAKTGDPKLKQLYGAITEDMNQTVGTVDKNLAKELKKINDNYKSGITKIESNVTQSILKSSPENIAKNLGSKNSITTVRQIKTMVGQDAFHQVSDAFVGKMLEGAYTRGKFDVVKFQKNLGKFDRPVLQELLGDERLSALEDVVNEIQSNQELQNAMKSATKIREGSQTGFLNQQLIERGAMPAFLTALATGHLEIAAGILAGWGGQYGLAKVFKTAAGKRYVTSGFNLSPSVRKYLVNASSKLGKGAEIQNVTKHADQQDDEMSTE